MRKLCERQIAARIAMYDEAINALFCYESADEDENEQESAQKAVVISQIQALRDRFIARQSAIKDILLWT